MSKNKVNDTFLASCCLFANKYQYNSNNKLVLVEGAQDYKLFTRVGSNENVKYMDIDHFRNDYIRGYFSPNDIGSKKNILYIMGNWRIDGHLFKKVSELNLYAIVDRDYDDEFPMGKYDRVFSSDAHDLETMLLKTDENLNEKIALMFNSKEIFDTAKFMVYQIAIIKKCLKKSNINIYYKKIRSADINKFFESDAIDVKKYVNYLVNSNESNNKIKSSLNKKSIYAALVKLLKKDIDSNGVLRVKKDGFIILHQ